MSAINSQKATLADLAQAVLKHDSWSPSIVRMLAEEVIRLSGPADDATPRTDALLSRAAQMPPVKVRGELVALCKELERDGNYWAGQAIELEKARASFWVGQEHGPRKLWLWKNFVDGDPQYWAFESPFPTFDNGDPITLGSPAGYALLKPCTDGRDGRSDAAVVEEIKRALKRQSATDSEANK